MKREREMDEVRFAQEQHEFKQKDEAFDHEQAMPLLFRFRGRSIRTWCSGTRPPRPHFKPRGRADNEEAMTKFHDVVIQDDIWQQIR
jgi:hypothetical protein